MEGKSHVASGWCTGVLAAGALSLPDAAIVGFGLVAAGASALNDLDHDDAAASRVLGPLSRLLAELVQAYARVLYRLTRGPGDPVTRGAHRGATHALPLLPIPCVLLLCLPLLASGSAWAVAGAAGWDTAVAWRWGGPVAVGMVIGFCLLLAADRLGSGLLVVVGGGFSVGAWSLPNSAALADPAAALVDLAPWVALAVLVGTVTHVLGDEITEYGLYLLAPLYRTDAGTEDEKRWVRLALPKWAAFKTGKWFEKLVVFPLLVVAGVLIAPGVWPVATEAWRWVG